MLASVLSIVTILLGACEDRFGRGEKAVLRDLSDRVARPCHDAEGHTWVILAIGQSNAANTVMERHSAGPAVLQFNAADGACYAAADPLAGASGRNGSIWGRLGDRLIAHEAVDRVVLAPVAVGGAQVADWMPEHRLHPQLESTLDALSAAGLEITHVLWLQGEADAKTGTPRTLYADRLGGVEAFLRRQGVRAPFYVSLTSRCGDIAPNSEIRAAQRAVIASSSAILAGPDTDQVHGRSDRFDGCHLTAKGAEAYAKLWAIALLEPSLGPDDHAE